MDRYRLVVGILTFNRRDLLKRTLASFYKKCEFAGDKDIKIVLFDNGSEINTARDNKKTCQHFGIDYHGLESELIAVEDNEKKDAQIALGHHHLLTIMKSFDSRAYMILEDDWECLDTFESKGLAFMTDLLYESDCGQIRLRECMYDGSLKGCSNSNFVTGDLIKWQEGPAILDRTLRKGNLHWVNNPCLISREALEIVSNKFDDEIHCMEVFHDHFPNNYQLSPGYFNHIGPWRKRNDLIEKGYVKDEK